MTLFASRYRLDEPLGQGGMGQVVKAHDTVLSRYVAIKLLPEDRAADPSARARLRREALAAAALDHPYICKIHEVGEHEGRSFFVMELVEGRTLDRVLHDGDLTPRQWLACVDEIVQALEEAHRRGLAHRDLKPSNIMLTVHGHVKVLDFGLAKHVDTVGPGDTSTTTGLTDPGTRVGTLSYMSPEQVLGSPLDPRSDIFSLGVVLHEIASGRHPFQRVSAAETMAAILRDPPAGTEGDLDLVPGFGRVVHRMLAKACAERYQAMTEVRADLDVLREGLTGSTPSAGTTAASREPAERTALVARDDELQVLTGHLDQMLLGQGGMVLLGGEPGVGKTRLARELQRLARARGCLTLSGHSYEQEGAPPFGPFAETIEQAARLVPQGVKAALGEFAPEVATLAPVLRRIFPDIGDPPAVPPEQQRRLLFNAYSEYAQRGTRKSASVLLFDDLHWADDASLQLLLHLAPQLPTMRLLVVGTYRDVELDTQRPFARTLETLLRQRLATRVSLRRLDQDGVAAMLTTLSGAPPPSSFVRVVYQETDGNPFFIEEVFQHLAEEGKLFDDTGRWKANLKADEIDVPEGVRLVISRRLDRLGDAAKRVMASAAILGRTFPLDLLLAVSDVAEDVVLDTLESAERAQLLRTERGRDARYSFVHELIRGTLVSGMALPRRQRLHARVADALERLRSSSLDASLAMLAHHLYQAGTSVDVQRTTDVLVRAAARALESAAIEDALALVDQIRSLELAGDSRAHAIADETEAVALMAMGRLDAAKPAAHRALDRWAADHDDAGILRLGEILSNAYLFGAGGTAPARQVVERALSALNGEAARERAVLQARLSLLLVHEGRLGQGLAARDAAVVSARHIADAVSLAAVEVLAADVSWQLGRVAEAQIFSEAACRRLEGSRDWLAVYALGMQVAVGGSTGRPAPALVARLIDLATQLGDLGGQYVGRTWKADALRTGDLEATRDYYLGLLADFGLPSWRFIDHLLVAGASFWLGEVDAARRHLIDAVAHATGDAATGSTAWSALPTICLAGFTAWTGDAAEAREALMAAESLLPKVGQPAQVGAWMGVNVVVSAWSVLGERAQVAGLYPLAAEQVSLGHVLDTITLGPNLTHVHAGTAASAARLPDRAAEHFAEAHEVADRVRYPALPPLVDLWHGKHLLDQGAATCDEGAARLRAAAAGFAKLKAPLHEALARRWLQEGTPPSMR